MHKLIGKTQIEQLHEYLSTDELKCQCKNVDCTYTIYNEKAVQAFIYTRLTFGNKIKITSGYRCQRHNRDSGGVNSSKHKSGQAHDLAVHKDDMGTLRLLAEKWYDVVIPYPDKGFIHCHITA